MKRLALVLSFAMIFGVFAANAQVKPAAKKVAPMEQTTKTVEKKKVVKKKPVKKGAKSTTIKKETKTTK